MNLRNNCNKFSAGDENHWGKVLLFGIIIRETEENTSSHIKNKENFNGIMR